MLARFSARPSASPRPVRPMRWMWISASGVTSTLITASSCAMSSPRAATSVATSTEQLRLANCTSTWSRSRCSSSPYSASALKPCACSTCTRSRHCCLVLQKASVLAGRKWFSSRLTACSRSLSFTSYQRWRILPSVVLRLHRDLLRALHELRAELGDAFGVGGREQQRLALLRALPRDLGDVVEEAHVEHAVGFVEHQRVERVELEAAALEVVHDAARRADHDVRAVLQAGELRRAAATPPHSVTTLMFSSARARRRISVVTWSASSRVGHSTMACTAKRRALRLASSASAKAAVLPLPVLACAIRSLPSSAGGRLAAWIGVICR